MRVLYYNWVDYEDAQKRGGGVTVYQRNLVDAATRAGDEVAFLSSGIAYGLIRRKPRIRRVRGSRVGVRKYEIVNSPILSPGSLNFEGDALAHPVMEELFADFLKREGPFDAIHFNNLEGIPASFATVARHHAPRAKIILSLHNYYPFCPQVNLWFQERANCIDYCSGKKCVNCLPHVPNPVQWRKDYLIQTLLHAVKISHRPILNQIATSAIHKYIRPLYRRIKRNIVRQPAIANRLPLRILDRSQAESYDRRRRVFVEVMNRDMDHLLAVSERVAEIAIGMGVRRDKVSIAYIGTAFANAPAQAQRSSWDGSDRPLSIAYLGYMRRDKGFYFFLKALEKMPMELSAQISVTLAAKINDARAVDRLRSIAHRFAAVTVHDGYSHESLASILANVDLGIVPVLWEDNLPQVAIEMVGSGIPILTSQLGGARELLRCPELTFQAGSRQDLYAKLEGVISTPGLLARAIAGRSQLYTPAEHYAILRNRYYVPRMQNAVLAPAA